MKKYIKNRIQDLKFFLEYLLRSDEEKVDPQDNMNNLLHFSFSKLEDFSFTQEYEENDYPEVDTLIDWWLSRISRKDPFKEFDAFIDSLDDEIHLDTKGKFYFSEQWRNAHPQLHNKIRELLKNARELESKYYFEDKEMLHRVIDVLIEI